MTNFFYLTAKRQKKFQKFFSFVAIFSLILQIGSGVLLYNPGFAEEEINSTQEQVESKTEETPFQPTEKPQAETTPSLSETSDLTGTDPVTVTPTPTIEVIPTETPDEPSQDPTLAVTEPEKGPTVPEEGFNLDVSGTDQSSAQLKPEVTTDKYDYAPEETVTISGQNFPKNTVLLIKVTRPDGSVVKGDGSFEEGSDEVTTDSEGKFTYLYKLDGITGEYKVEVFQDGEILATTTFTDSNNSSSNGQCKKEDAECNINASGKECCEGLICVPFNPQPGNGKCLKATPTPVPPFCPNQATPTPSVSPFTLIDRIDLGDSTSEASHQATGWGADPGIGNYGGRDSGNFALVVAKNECNDNGRVASFKLKTNGKYANNLKIRHLDGMSNLDSFDVYVNNNFLAHYNDSQDSQEIWRTEEYPLNNLTGEIEVKIILTDQIWSGCSTYGQLAINWVEIEGYECPACGNQKKEGNEECDGTDGVTQGQNFCTVNCKLVPIYDGGHSCPAGTVKSQTPILSKVISATDPDGETFSLTSGGKYLFEASGTFRPTSPAGWYADAGYTTKNNWSSVEDQYGIHGIGDDYAAHALLANLGNGVGVVDWGNYNSDHVYTKYYEPTASSVQFVIGDRYGDWFNTSWQNQKGMSDNSGSLTLNVYECKPVSEVKVCKYDNNRNPLPGWRVYLLGEKLNTFSIPSNGNVINAGNYDTGNYALIAAGVYNYGDSRMNADAANSYRYVGLPCAGSTDGWVNGEASSCMNNYLSLNFSPSGGPTAPGWGNYYNPEHIYAKSFTGGEIKLKIWDRCNSSQLEGCYGDNEGSLNLDIYKGYVGDTGNDGCVTFSNVPYGKYQLGEILKNGWEKISGQGEVTVDNSEENFALTNKELPKLGNLQVKKIVDWNQTSPNQDKTFEICIQGPSFAEPDCKTVDYNGGILDWSNIIVGNYKITETNPGENWIVTGSNQTVAVTENKTTYVEVKNKINPVIIKAYKIVCNSEADLPNWSGGADINANTASNFIANHPNCHLEPGWDFQWGFADKTGKEGVDKLNGPHIGLADGTPSTGLCPAPYCGPNTSTGTAYNQWKTFGPTDENGEAIAVINDLEGAPGIWVRESLKAGYVPFSYPPDSSPGSSVSAEIYCHTDVSKYDNYDQIVSPQYGNTYYCVAFNALNYGSVSGKKYDGSEEGTVLSGWSIVLTGISPVSSLDVPANGGAVNSPSLESGKKYLVKVSGAAQAGDNIHFDAECASDGGGMPWINGVPRYLSYGENLLDLKINDSFVDWGSCQPINHTYYYLLTGSGSPVSFKVYDIYYPNNTGNLKVEIYEVVKEDITDSSGYGWNDVLAGNYQLCEIIQPGWNQIKPGTFGAPNCYSVTVAPDSNQTFNFVNFRLGQIRACKYDDYDGDGKLDEGESGIAGVTITLEKESGEDWETITSGDTGNDGCYTFTGLALGYYRISEDLSDLPGYTPTSPISVETDISSSGQLVAIDFFNELQPITLELAQSNSVSGTTVTYTIFVHNTSPIVAHDVKVNDVLPLGFSYKTGTTKFDGVSVSDPAVLGQLLTFSLGDLDPDQVVAITFDANIGGLPDGTYPNPAVSWGTNRVSGHPDNQTSYSNFDYSEVKIASGVSTSTAIGGTTAAVLGAATSLSPSVLGAATGSETLWLVLTLFMILTGFALRFLSDKKKKAWLLKKLAKIGKRLAIFTFVVLALFTFVGNTQAIESLFIRVAEFPEYVRTDNLKLYYTALEREGKPITVSCYVEKDGGFTWKTFGGVKTEPSGYCEVFGHELSGDGTYRFKAIATSPDGSTESNITTTIIDRVAPGAPGDYSKSRESSTSYRIHFKNPGDADYGWTRIFASQTQNFTADDSTKKADVGGGPNQEFDYLVSGLEPDKEYFFALQGFDKAGNASGLSGDGGTVTYVEVTPTSTSGVGDVEKVVVLPKEEGKGEILGGATGSSVPTEAPETAERPGVLGEVTKAASQIKPGVILAGLGAIIILAVLVYLSRKRSS